MTDANRWPTQRTTRNATPAGIDENQIRLSLFAYLALDSLLDPHNVKQVVRRHGMPPVLEFSLLETSVPYGVSLGPQERQVASAGFRQKAPPVRFRQREPKRLQDSDRRPRWLRQRRRRKLEASSPRRERTLTRSLRGFDSRSDYFVTPAIRRGSFYALWSMLRPTLNLRDYGQSPNSPWFQ